MVTPDVLMTLTKSTNKNMIVKDDIITFTITARNDGDVIIGNVDNDPVYIYDILSPELEFVGGSIEVDSIQKKSFDINAGVNLGAIDVGKSKVIKFKAKVISNSSMTIENKATGSFGYLIPGSVPKKSNVDSNTVLLQIYSVNLNILKSADKEMVVLKDIVTYTVTLANTGTTNLINVNFKDLLPKGSILIDGSFKINGKVINKVDLKAGVNVGNILPGQSIVIEYKIKIITAECNLTLYNNAYAKYYYTLPDGSTGFRESSFIAKPVYLAINNFKQLSIDEYIKIPDEKENIEDINNIQGYAQVLDMHVIETIQNTSVEGQILTGYKLVLHCILKLVVEYVSCDEYQRVHSCTYNIPFSSFIILPENYIMGNKVDVDCKVEDVSYKLIDCKTMFTTSYILINAKMY